MVINEHDFDAGQHRLSSVVVEGAALGEPESPSEVTHVAAKPRKPKAPKA